MGCGKSKSRQYEQQKSIAQLTELQKQYFSEEIPCSKIKIIPQSSIGEKIEKIDILKFERLMEVQTPQMTEKNYQQLQEYQDQQEQQQYQQQQQQKENSYLEQKRSEQYSSTGRGLALDTERMQEESGIMEIQNLSQNINFLSSLSVSQQNSEYFLLIEYIQKMPKVYEVYQKFGDFQPKSKIYLGGIKQTGKLLKSEGMYEGEWKDNKKCGFGSLIQLNKGFYQGYFENDEFTYEGRFISIDGSFLEGEWKNSKLNGIGVIETANFHYKGEVKDGEPNGEGCKDYGKYYYQGQFYRGMQHGKGKHTFKNGSEFEGDFFEGKRQGKGCYRFPNHKVYEGDFNDGEITGEGTMIWPNGQRYKGHFEKGLRHGFGQLIDENGIQYSGEWIQGLKNGQFILERDKIIKIHNYKKGIPQS